METLFERILKEYCLYADFSNRIRNDPGIDLKNIGKLDLVKDGTRNIFYKPAPENNNHISFYAIRSDDPSPRTFSKDNCIISNVSRKTARSVALALSSFYSDPQEYIPPKNRGASYAARWADKKVQEAAVVEPSSSYFEHHDDELGDLDLDYYKNDPQAVVVPFSYDQETGASFSCGEPFRIFGRHLDPLKQAHNAVSLGEEDRRIRAVAVTDSDEKELKDVYTLEDDGEYYNEERKLLNLTTVSKIGPTESCIAVIDDWNVDTAPEYFA